MAVDTLEMAQAMRKAELPQEHAGMVAEQIDKGLWSGDLATEGSVRAEFANLSCVLSRRLVGMLLLQTGLIVALMKLL